MHQEHAERLSILFVPGRQDIRWRFGESLDAIMLVFFVFFIFILLFLSLDICFISGCRLEDL